MTQMSAFGSSPGVGSVGLAFEVAKNGARVDPEISGRAGPIAAVSLEDVEDVLPGEVLARLSERNDSALLVASEVEVIDANERLVGQNDRLFDPVLELANVPGPIITAHRFECLWREPLDRGAELGGVFLE